jgi:biopolymer transport protein ExbD
MAFSNTSGGPLRAEINITPMIDILLVLIIVFMVVVSMSQEKGLKAQIPQPATEKSPPQPERTIVIQIAWSGDNRTPTIKINDEDVPWEKLHDRLSTIFTGELNGSHSSRGTTTLTSNLSPTPLTLRAPQAWRGSGC